MKHNVVELEKQNSAVSMNKSCCSFCLTTNNTMKTIESEQTLRVTMKSARETI